MKYLLLWADIQGRLTGLQLVQLHFVQYGNVKY